MGIQYDIHNHKGIVWVRARGTARDLGEFQPYCMAILQACKEYQLDRILCDERDLAYELSITDTYYLVEFLADHAPDGSRAALVCDPRDLPEDLFWETACINRGLYVRVFTDIEEAEAWLVTEPPPSGPDPKTS